MNPRTQFKSTSINVIKKVKEFKGIIKYFITLHEGNEKHPSDVQENTNTWMNEMMTIIPNLKAEFNRETLK